MVRPTLLVPSGAEAAAARRGAGASARIVEVCAGPITAASLPALADTDPIVVLGLCGALRHCRVGETVVYRRVVDERGSFACDPGLVARRLPDAHPVDGCTARHVVTTVAERRALAARFDADVVDMEGTHLAAALSARGLPFAMVRIVSDDERRDLPALEDAIGEAGVRPLHVAFAFLRSPRDAFAFVRDVQRALATLGDVAAALTRPAA